MTLEAQLQQAAVQAREQEKADPETPIVTDDEVDDAIGIVARVIRRVEDVLPPPFNYIASGALTLLEVFIKPRETPIGHVGEGEEDGGDES